jgi:radical SAM-linked protein
VNDVKDFRTVRITFSKKGRARFISHLDLNRTMTRAVRRANLPIWYTEGFNRHPYLTFAAPLSLGYEGEQETMDLRLEQDMEMSELVTRLDAVMPEGLHIKHAAWAVCKAGDVDRAVYRLQLNGCQPEAVTELFAQSQVLVEKRNKKKEWKTIDIKPVLDTANAQITPTETGTQLELTLPCNSTDTVNPALVTEALRQLPNMAEFSVSVCRLAVLDKNGNRFA